MNFFEILYAQKNGAALPTNFFDLLFAKSFTPAEEWGEYDGTLPATYSANGDYLVDYRIYGASGGVGDITVNTFNKKATNTNNGYVMLKYLLLDGTESSGTGSSYYFITEYTLVPSGAETLSLINNANASNTAICFYDANKTYISGVNNKSTPHSVVSVPAGAVYYRSSIERGKANIAMVVEGSTAPAEYVPYGYEVDMSVSDGTTSTITPIYIGSAPLEEDEYVDYATGKIYRRTENLWDGVYEQGGLDFTTGETFASANYVRTERMQCSDMTDIAFTYFTEAERGVIVFYDGNGDYIREGSTMVISGGGSTFEYHDSVPSGAAYVAISFSAANSSQPISPETAAQVMVVEGSTAPSTYIPYYNPQNPPVNLPALPTVDGTNIANYAGQSATPSRFYAKYRKEGFK